MFARFFAKVRAWLILTRGSNLPTVWSNLFAGWLLGYVYADRFPWGPFLLTSLIGLLIGVSLIYVGGMILNDAFDARWDTERRSTRPIPSGLVSVTAAHVVGFLCLAIGSWFTVVSSLDGHGRATFTLVVLLVASVLVYDRWHKGVSWAPAVMGLCRALLPLIGFFAVGGLVDGPHFRGWPLIALLAHPCVLWLLTFSITLVARHEAGPGTPPIWAEWLLYLVPVPLILVQALPEVNGVLEVAVFGCLLFWLWIWRSNRRHALPAGVGPRVADRLAAFPLVDYAAAGLFYFSAAFMRHGNEGSTEVGWASAAMPLAWMVPFGSFVLTLILRRFIPTT
ncbi:MAG: UbiA family prenyltransferase [Verrucomicrobia bacterium]|nr:UbiA family prenyltransferase [Verrucomicrobiota bacterium]